MPIRPEAKAAGSALIRHNEKAQNQNYQSRRLHRPWTNDNDEIMTTDDTSRNAECLFSQQWLPAMSMQYYDRMTMDLVRLSQMQHTFPIATHLPIHMSWTY